MSDSSSSDDSVPSLSSYPPAFVSLITTFIKRAEEAEIRAHKSLVILKAKDDQVLQLQERMDVLEKIACRLEEVMVPPLDLPKSPQLYEKLSGPHPRDVNIEQSSHAPLETLYERFNTAPQQKESSRLQDAHNCYEKCQYLIDGLERSNCQLRQALATESQQRVKDHEQYVATLSKMTQAFKDIQNKDKSHTQYTVKHCKDDNLNIPNETQQSIYRASGDADKSIEMQTNSIKNECPISSNRMAVFEEDFKKKIGLAENIISVLQRRLEKHQNIRNKTISIFKNRKSEKSIRNILSKCSLSSYHTPKSSSSGTLKLKRVHISSQCFLSTLKKQNKKLKNKYQHLCEKFTENLTLCEKLKSELINLSCKNIKNVESKVNQSTQTENNFNFSLFNDHQGKPQSAKPINLLQGRLEAAAKVMAKQCKQIQDLQKQLGENLNQVDSLRRRLSRAESTAASKEVLVEATKKQLQDSEKKNLSLSQELQEIKDSYCRLRQELVLKNNEYSQIKTGKEICESEFEEMKSSLETKLLTLGAALQQKEQFNDQMTNELQNKLSNIREQFIAQITEASDRLVAADFKIQELYLGVETFLKLLFSLNSPELSPSSQAQAVQVASDILQLPPVEVQTILHSSRYELRVSRWIRECNRLVYEKVFAKTLGNLLLDAVLEARLT